MPLHLWAKPADPNEVKIDDFEDPSRNGVPAARTNLWGGKWATVTQNSSIGVTYSGPGADSSRYSAGVTGILGAYGYAIFQSPLSSEGLQVPYDAACHGLIGIQFWMKGDGNTYRVGVPSAAVKDGDVTGDWYAADFTPPAGVWTFCQFPFKSLTRKFGRSAVANLPEHPDGSDVTGIQFYPLKPGDFSYSVDQISFYGSYVPNCSTPVTTKEISTPTITFSSQSIPTRGQIAVAGDDATKIWVNNNYLGSEGLCINGCDPMTMSLPIPFSLLQGQQICLAIETDNVQPDYVYSSWELEINREGGKPFLVSSENPSNSGVSLYWDPTGAGNCGSGSPPPLDNQGHSWTNLQYNPNSNPFNSNGVIVTSHIPWAGRLNNLITNDVIPLISYDKDGFGSGSDKSCGILYWRQIVTLPKMVQTTPTITPTPLGNDCLDRVIDDFDDPSRNGVSPDRVNLWGGKWNTITASDTEINVSYSDPGAEGTRFCATMKGSNWQTDGGDAVYQTHLFSNGAPFNSVIHGLAGIQFWVKGDGNSYWFNLFSSSDTNSYTFNIVPLKGIWTLFKIPFKNMNLKSSEVGDGEDKHPDGSDVTGIGFEFKDRGSFALSVDKIAFYGNPSNCPQPKAPEEPTLVPTASPTPTLTAIYTFTPWPTATPFSTAAPRPMLVPSFNSRPSPTPIMPLILSFSQPTFVPISTPTPRPWPKRIKLKPTPTWVWNPTRTTATPLPTRTPILKTMVAIPTTVAPALLNLLDREQIIQFSAPPANIYVTFADGPGWYQLKIVDGQNNLIKTIYDHHVVAESDAWADWDGQDAKGNDMPPGQYFVVIYKDGTALKSLLVIRSPANQ